MDADSMLKETRQLGSENISTALVFNTKHHPFYGPAYTRGYQQTSVPQLPLGNSQSLMLNFGCYTKNGGIRECNLG